MIWLVIFSLWGIATLGAMIMTIVQADKDCLLTGARLTKRWWLPALAYVVYVIVLCTALTLFILNHAGLL